MVCFQQKLNLNPLGLTPLILPNYFHSDWAEAVEKKLQSYEPPPSALGHFWFLGTKETIKQRISDIALRVDRVWVNSHLAVGNHCQDCSELPHCLRTS